MKDTMRSYIQKLIADRAKRRKVGLVLCVLSLLVAAGVFWQLRMTGITMGNEVHCGKVEHIHTEECSAEKRLICGFEEAEGETALPQHHIHTDACYEIVYSCGLEEHTHTVACYSDPDADLETASDWENTLPDMLTGERAADLVAVAQSQLGYKESKDNFILAEDGETVKGYTRYGEWYGNPYGDWSAMFASFCLNYAGISRGSIPYNSGCYAWAARLDHDGLLCWPGDDTPVPGDLVFFDRDSDGAADHVGIVSEICKPGVQPSLTVIEGDCENRVDSRSYRVGDPALFAYVRITEEPATQGADEEEQAGFPSLPETGYAARAAAVATESALKAAFTNGQTAIQLTADFSVIGSISLASGTYTLDLNGHKLTASGQNSLFRITGGSLTIIDSAAGSGADSFTYSVTESAVKNNATGATTETKKTNRVALAGQIIGGSGPVVEISGGSFTLESGALCNGTGRAVHMTGGETRLTGGYIFGFTKTSTVDTADENFGGAIRAIGGVLSLSGTVLAKNSALNGGAIYAKDAAVTITGGVISENKSTRVTTNWNNHSENSTYRCGGGGIYCDGAATLTMTGGYITNNTAADSAYFDGGGGVFISGTTSFELTGGYITGNEAAGGGGVRSDWNRKTTFLMTGGFISGNTAKIAEGGGVAITQGGKSSVTGGYITNNVTNTQSHWGGGGLFCSDGAYLTVYNVLITENGAGGFGGGVAGCSTGRVYICVKKGGAIYQNSAEGTNLSGGGSTKNEDHTYAADSPVFMANGYQDYFCALNSLVEGGMLGGGAANWSGSMDGVAISNVPVDATLEAAYVMGLTAAPNAEAIAGAQGLARAFINGNSSHTHGGGILCNGYLLVGDKNPIAVGSRLTLNATKKLTQNGGSISLGGYAFTFHVKDEAGKIVSIGTSDQNGNISFDRLLSFTEELCKDKIAEDGGTASFVYTLAEEPPGPDYPEVSSDSAQYRITVTVKRVDETLPFTDQDGNPVKKTYYKIDKVDVQKSFDGGKIWSQVDYNYQASSDEQHGGTLKLTPGGATFTNKVVETTAFTVMKQWVGGSNYPQVTVDLLQDGKVYDTITLSGENGWAYTWEKLPMGHVYTVHEHSVPGYTTTYQNGIPDGQPAGWHKVDHIEEGGAYLLVSADGYALTGSPGTNGAYDFGAGNWKKVNMQNGSIAPGDVDEAMQWRAEALSGKGGLYLRNLPSNGKHYLSYQGTSTVKATSSNTSYASRVESCANGLRLYQQGGADVKYVAKNQSKVSASTSNNNALYVYQLSGSGGENTITIVNTQTDEPVYNLRLTKVDANDPRVSLAGAVFQIYQDNTALTFRQEDGQYLFDADGAVTELTTDANGQLNVIGLPEGTYLLREIKAPEGYALAEDRTITFPGEAVDGANTLEITVEDTRLSYSLPAAGGPGQAPFAIGGLLLMAAALISGCGLRRRRERRAKN